MIFSRLERSGSMDWVSQFSKSAPVVFHAFPILFNTHSCSSGLAVAVMSLLLHSKPLIPL